MRALSTAPSSSPRWHSANISERVNSSLTYIPSSLYFAVFRHFAHFTVFRIMGLWLQALVQKKCCEYFSVDSGACDVGNSNRTWITNVTSVANMGNIETLELVEGHLSLDPDNLRNDKDKFGKFQQHCHRCQLNEDDTACVHYALDTKECSTVPSSTPMNRLPGGGAKRRLLASNARQERRDRVFASLRNHARDSGS